MISKVKYLDVASINEATDKTKYPTYSKDAINLANRHGRGTRKDKVGQLSNLINEFRNDPDVNDYSVEGWTEWHNSKFPNARQVAIDATWNMFKKMRTELSKVRKNHIESWIDDLLYNKTYNGLMAQKAILQQIINENEGFALREATPEDESLGIDGYINEKPVQVKPVSYKEAVVAANDEYNCAFVFYEKKNKSFEFEYNPEDFL